MALEEEKKLEVVRDVFIARLLSYQTWTDFKSFLQNVTKAQIRTFILNALQQKEIILDSRAANSTQQADDVGELYTELDSDISTT